ncbi:MAG: hypothetical protein FJ379_12365 [Verrucomicrobia bacterium]|nr:hypothetical protein [Verrucomicrobiota bacterium]
MKAPKIESSDPPESLLDRCFEALGGESGPGHGPLYGRTHIESLKWLQTPGIWGASPSDNSYWQGPDLPAASQDLLDAMAGAVGGTRRFLDIASLEPFATGRFADLLTVGLGNIACSGLPVTVRILFGSHPYSKESPESLARFLERITARVPRDNSGLKVVAGRMVTSTQGMAHTWNHAKIIASDGRRVVVGGHNLWSDDYFGFAPVHDLSARIDGAAAADAHRFLDQLWGWMTRNAATPSADAVSFSVGWDSGQIIPGLLPAMAPDFVPGTLGHPALYVARLGSGVLPGPFPGNGVVRVPCDAFRMATRSIRLSQMDLGLGYRGTKYWSPDLFQSLTDSLTHPGRSVGIEIVLSDTGAVAGSGTPYSWGITPREVLDQIRSRLADRPVTGTLKIAPIRTSASGDVWEHGGRQVKISNHAKLWMVDDRLFHVGSDNLYPHNLQEFGYVVESPSLAAPLLREYWNPMWTCSSKMAISLED